MCSSLLVFAWEVSVLVPVFFFTWREENNIIWPGHVTLWSLGLLSNVKMMGLLFVSGQKIKTDGLVEATLETNWEI